MLTDNEEIDRIIREYGNAILRMSYLMLKDYHLAEDVVQDTLIQVIKKYNTLQDKNKEKAWIMKIAENQCRNQLRGQWFKKIVLYEENKEIDKEIVEIEEDNIISDVLKLKEKYREVILLYYYQELSIKEISTVLGKKESNVQQLLKRAREKLKEGIENDDK